MIGGLDLGFLTPHPPTIQGFWIVKMMANWKQVLSFRKIAGSSAHSRAKTSWKNAWGITSSNTSAWGFRTLWTQRVVMKCEELVASNKSN